MNNIIVYEVNGVNLYVNREENFMIYTDEENKIKYKFYSPLTIGNNIMDIFKVFVSQLKLSNKDYYKKFLKGHFCSSQNMNLKKVKILIEYEF